MAIIPNGPQFGDPDYGTDLTMGMGNPSDWGNTIDPSALGSGAAPSTNFQGNDVQAPWQPQSTMPTQLANTGGAGGGGGGGTTAGNIFATKQQQQQHNPYGAKGFLGVNPINNQPVWSDSVLAGTGTQTDTQKLQDLTTAQGIFDNPFTYAQNPGSTNMYSGEFSAYNPQYTATMDTANRLSSLTGGKYGAQAFQNPGRNYQDTFLGGGNAGAIAQAVMKYGSINHPIVQQLLKGGGSQNFSETDAGRAAFNKPAQAQVGQNNFAPQIQQNRGGGQANPQNFSAEGYQGPQGYGNDGMVFGGGAGGPMGQGGGFRGGQNPFQNNNFSQYLPQLLSMLGLNMGGMGFGGNFGAGQQSNSMFSQAFMNRRPSMSQYGQNPFFSRFQ